ncbi:MAG: 2-oxoglutarate ferredoxin oxidoreductase subunit beta [Gammaproteobacteria bacterium]|jgi:2-oxoglutarate ferredoxin oxidoreductase subunit beta
MSQVAEYTRKDFSSEQEVRWCPGCGDYSVLAQVQRIMPEICTQMDLKKENIVFISGIGCASRFPYYMNNFGFHTIHGRAPTIASGLTLSRPDLQVWVVTGDGDGLSIGGNHLIHSLRRNVNIKIMLFNNRIYGLTKGQYSPTSEIGKKTKSSPMGSLERPLNPLSLALASEATFIARAIATEGTQMRDVLLQAAQHNGSAFIEIFQNCNVFNDGTFDDFAAKKNQAENSVFLRHGEPVTFGKDNEKAICVRAKHGAIEPYVVNVADVDKSEILVHDEQSPNSALSHLLAQMETPEFPMPLGVFRSINHPSYNELLDQQVEQAKKNQGLGDLKKHLRTGETWSVS